jgi:cytochrome c-type biogenesis protein CcmH
MIWIAPVLLIVIVLAALLLPLRRAGALNPPRAAYDQAVYRDQLLELDRDIARGLLAPSEVAGTRLELQRRLLGVALDPSTPPPKPVGKPLIALLAVLVTASAAGIYLTVGAPGLPDMPFTGREASGTNDPEKLAALAETLEARLQAGAGTVEGWLLLGRTAAGLDQWPRAANAYRQAVLLGAAGPEPVASYGEALVMQAQGVVTQAAKQAFTAALTADRGFPIARYYLALADAQAGDAKAAIAAWMALAAELPDNAEARAVLAQRITETATAANLPIPKLPPGAK